MRQDLRRRRKKWSVKSRKKWRTVETPMLLPKNQLLIRQVTMQLLMATPSRTLVVRRKKEMRTCSDWLQSS